MAAGEHAVAVGEDAPVLEVMATMRAMRRLRPDPVPAELLERLVEAATWAPSGSNAQAYEWVVTTDRDVVAELAVVWRRCFELYVSALGVGGPALQDPGIRRAIDYQNAHFHETPAVLTACYAYPRRTDPRALREVVRRLSASEAARLLKDTGRLVTLTEASSIYPGVQNLLLAARALGLGAVITIWHLFLEHEWKRVLGIPREVHTYAVVPVGWPKGRFGPVRRRPAREAIHRDRW